MNTTNIRNIFRASILKAHLVHMVGIVAVVAAAMTTASCEDHFDIGKIEGEPQIVMYCMPSCSDTTIISLAESIPVNTKPSELTTPHRLSDATVTFRLNGVEQKVENLGKGEYRVVAKQKAGDVIRIKASHAGLPDAEAVTVIPETVEAEIVSMADVRADADGDGDFRDYVQLAARFNDDPKTKDYYAVRVMADYRFYCKDDHIIAGGNNFDDDNNQAPMTDDNDQVLPPKGYYLVKSQSYIRWQELNIQNEPLLKPLTNADSDFGFERNFYQNFYIFDDSSLHSSSYTLHLNVPKEATGGIAGQEFLYATIRYKVVMYKISETAYRFFKGLNDIDGNDFANYGFSQIAPTPSNVEGGLGFVGGYSSGKGKWKQY